MWSALRRQALSGCSSHQWETLTSPPATLARRFCSSSAAAITNIENNNHKEEMLSLAEVRKILSDVGADDVKVIAAPPQRCEVTDYMVIATGRSAWHVRNISQALIYKVKQKQRGAKRMLLPTVVGQEGGKWIVIDSGTLIVHAVDENARAYYNLEGLWKSDTSEAEPIQDLEKAFVKFRPKNNSKKPSQARV